MGASAGINRHLYDLYLARPDLQRAFPDLDGEDGPALVEWAHRHGRHEVPIAADLLPDAGDPQGAAHASPNGHGPPPLEVPPDWWGVNLVGYLRSELGLGEGARQVVAALDARGIPLLPIQARVPPDCRQEHPFTALDPVAAAFPVNVIYANPDGLWTLYRETGRDLFAGRHSIGFWWWEVEGAIPLDWLSIGPGLIDEVWVGSRHVAACLEPYLDLPIHQVRMPVSVPDLPPRSRAELGLPEGFLFLFAFDYNSAFERKNPLGIVEAFSQAFRPGEGATLAIKCINSEVDPENHARLQAAAEHPDVHVLDGYATAEEKDALLAACDCFVSLHRAEGFGHALAEAMYLGKPVIATGYSGNLDYMSPRNSYLVDYAMTDVGPGVRVYPPEGRWAAPDARHAARRMREVFDDPEAAARRGRIAAADIRASHSPAAAGASLEAALEAARVEIAARRREPSVADARARLAETAALIDAGEGEPHRRPGALRRAARRTALRLMRPHTTYEHRVDEGLRDTLATSVATLDDVARRTAGAEVANARAYAEVLAALRRNGRPVSPGRTHPAGVRRRLALPPLPATAAADAPHTPGAEELQRQVDAVPYWWHSIDLGESVITPGAKGGEPGFMTRELHSLRLPEDLGGRTVLDIGAWDGFYSFEAERRGAARVVALDHYAWEIDRENGDRRHPDTLPGRRGFDLAHRALGSRVEPLVADFMEVDLDDLGTFDLVLFLGVLYHVADPLGAMRRVAAATKELAIVETAAVAVDGREERPLWEFHATDEFDGDPTTWWVPNLPAVHALCRAAGFARTETVVGRPAHAETYRAVVHAWR